MPKELTDSSNPDGMVNSIAVGGSTSHLTAIGSGSAPAASFDLNTGKLERSRSRYWTGTDTQSLGTLTAAAWCSSQVAVGDSAGSVKIWKEADWSK